VTKESVPRERESCLVVHCISEMITSHLALNTGAIMTLTPLRHAYHTHRLQIHSIPLSWAAHMYQLAYFLKHPSVADADVNI